jgi:hypothetical protein
VARDPGPRSAVGIRELASIGKPDTLREHDEGDRSDHRSFVGSVTGCRARGADEAAVRVEAQGRGGHTVAAGNRADRQDLGHLRE